MLSVFPRIPFTVRLKINNSNIWAVHGSTHSDHFSPNYVILATWEAEIQRINVRGQPGLTICETPISKLARAKWTRGVALVAECLLCNCKALSSDPSPTKKRKKFHCV
jgi:hypothetical protein